jgi:hypothetical protein
VRSRRSNAIDCAEAMKRAPLPASGRTSTVVACRTSDQASLIRARVVPGAWYNPPALAFWRGVTEEAAPGEVEELAGNGKRWAGPVLRFATKTVGVSGAAAGARDQLLHHRLTAPVLPVNHSSGCGPGERDRRAGQGAAQEPPSDGPAAVTVRPPAKARRG